MKRPEIEKDVPAGPCLHFPDAAWSKGLPQLVEHLTTVRWDDGTERETSTLTIKCQDDRVLIVLNDREMSRSLYASAEGVQDGLKAIEKHLVAGTGDWRAWVASGGKKKK